MQHRVASRSEIAPGTTKCVRAGDLEVLLCNVEGSIFAIEDVCTHDGGALDQGELQGACIECPRHGAIFDVRTGAVLALPAVIPLMTFPVEVRDDDVYVDV